MKIDEVINDLSLLSEDEQYEIKSFIQALISKGLHQNKKTGEVKVQFVIEEEKGLYFTGYHSSDDPRNEKALYKYQFLANREIIAYEGHGDRDYFVNITIKDIAFLIKLNKGLIGNTQEEVSKPQLMTSPKSYLYELTYVMDEGTIKLNGTKFHSFKLDSQSEQVFQYIIDHANTEISYEILKEEVNMQKTIDNFLKDIKMNQLMRDLFFPRTNNKKIYFRPRIEIEISSHK